MSLICPDNVEEVNHGNMSLRCPKDVVRFLYFLLNFLYSSEMDLRTTTRFGGSTRPCSTSLINWIYSKACCLIPNSSKKRGFVLSQGTHQLAWTLSRYQDLFWKIWNCWNAETWNFGTRAWIGSWSTFDKAQQRWVSFWNCSFNFRLYRSKGLLVRFICSRVFSGMSLMFQHFGGNVCNQVVRKYFQKRSHLGELPTREDTKGMPFDSISETGMRVKMSSPPRTHQ
jgi:hypothetical protein